MANCELCGKETSLVSAIVEGVQMSLCKNCAGHGKVLDIPVIKRAPEKHRTVRDDEPVEQLRRDFSEVLRGERRKRNMTQSEFAQLLNDRESAVAHYENGTQKPSIELAKKLEKRLGVPLVETVVPGSEFVVAKTHSGVMTLGDLIKRKS